MNFAAQHPPASLLSPPASSVSSAYHCLVLKAQFSTLSLVIGEGTAAYSSAEPVTKPLLAVFAQEEGTPSTARIRTSTAPESGGEIRVLNTHRGSPGLRGTGRTVWVVGQGLLQDVLRVTAGETYSMGSRASAVSSSQGSPRMSHSMPPIKWPLEIAQSPHHSHWEQHPLLSM